jgi:sugar lactone lactonase YvrE
VWAEFGPLLVGTTEAEVFGQIKVAADGACLDAEGALWIADAVGGRLLRVKEGGEIADELQPGSGVFACALGGADGRTLYACVAPDFFEATRSVAREGNLVAFRVEVPGA